MPNAAASESVAAAATVSALARSWKLEEGSAVTGGAGCGGRTYCGFVELGWGWWLERFRFRPDAPPVGEEVDFLRCFVTGSDTEGG